MKSPISLRIKKQLNALDKELLKVIDSSGSKVKQGYLQTIKAGGKRLRPAIVFLCSQFNENGRQSTKKAALAVELIHVASLVHDDIMDGAKIRRGKPTVYSKWGDQVALRIGDYLFAQAFLLLSETGNFSAISALSKAVRKLSEGEIEQFKSAFQYNQALSYYFKKISCKTAALFRASAELGAIFGGANKSCIAALGNFGENLGLAFQIYDDILDVEAKEKELGKSLGTDLRDGTLTLPIIIALKETKSQRLANIFTRKNCTEEDIKEGLNIIASTKAAVKAKEQAKKFIGKGITSLEPINNEQLKKELKDICYYTIERYS